ncbi:hypothetical protein DMN91_009576 [Ooceraea biroi]|uniref:Apple domain-containing protein n=1 Tax=Ooceraea biroi TaxID=2015173 RepID=A0A3L8DB52_OOCBI|nr:hypothetical protein DMN91_009576 [Ooceraea biroi]
MGCQRGFLLLVCFLRSCQVSRAIELIFDNQLVVVANDCYTRVAIGSKLPDMDVFTSVAVGSVSECEDECSKRRNPCNAFAFGIGIKGNGTCALSSKMPQPEDLQLHADYDVYVKSQRTPQCEPDQLYKIGNGGIGGQKRKNETRPITRFGSGLLGPTMPSVLSSPGTMRTMMPSITNGPSYQQGFTPSFDDELRVSDILRNRNLVPPINNPFGINNAKVDNHDLSIPANQKFGQRIHPDPTYSRLDFGGSPFRNPFSEISRLNFASDFDSDLHSYKALTIHNEPFDLFSRPIFVHDGSSKNKVPADFGFWTTHDPTKYRNAIGTHLDGYKNQGFFNGVSKGSGITARTKQNGLIAGNHDVDKGFRPIVNPYTFEANGAKILNAGFRDIFETWNPELLTAFRGFGTKIRQTERLKSCYRRLLSGKKSREIRRAIECERLEDCHRACDYEKLFVCEGFNYRRIGHGTRGMCEMTSVPYSRTDLHRDFVSDPECDYYEKDPNCMITPPGGTRPTWNRWNQPRPSSQSYGPPYSINRPDVRPHIPDRRPVNEVPRPLDYDQRPSKEVPRPLDYDRRPSNEIPRPLDYDRRPSNEIPRPLDYDRRPSNEIPRPLDYGPRPLNHDRQPPLIYGDRGTYEGFDQRNYQDGQGSIRGEYPRPEDRFAYGGRFPPRRPTDDKFYNKDLPWARYPDRRIDHGPPYDIGTNEISSYLPDHRKDRDWGLYGTVYGSSYGYDTNYVADKFDIPKYHPQSRPKPRPYENDHFYGEFYNYGGAFGYGDSYIPADQDPIYGATGKTEECSVRAGAGFRLSRGVVRKTYLTPNLDQCESLYNVAPTDPTDNCLLSDISYKDLNFYVDLEPDRDYDIYAMINSRTCGVRRETSPHPPDECFWRVRSGFGMPTDVVKKSMVVDNLGQCQAECTIAQDFTCRSFTFKYTLEQGQSDSTNCYLSDWPSQDINPAQMPDMDGAELYERGSFGRGCELYVVPFFNGAGRFNGKQFKENVQGDEDTLCYSGYNKPCKLTPYAVLLATCVNSEQDCRQKCSKMRETDTVPCMSYSYKLTSHGTEENCLLSDVPVRDLRPGLDYVYDDNHVLYSWKDLDPHCVVTGYSIDDDRVFGGPGLSKPLLPGSTRPDFGPETSYPSVRPYGTHPDPRPFFTMPKPTSYHGMKPFDPDKPDPVGVYRPGGGYGSYGGSYDDKFEYGIRPGGFDQGLGSLYPNEYSTFRYYTVNGHPCKRGTKCEKNKIAGFWACETEGGEYGSWDYCCAPTHHCGFSQGYHYPWCYVGPSEDQWRPCSEKYYPYKPSPRPIRPIDSDRHDRPYDPGYYHGRHWPITYLHPQPPPNCTDSLASADNSGNRRGTTTTTTTTTRTLITTELPSSTTVKSDENSTVATTNRTRRLQRLRVRDDRHEVIFPRKIESSRIVVPRAAKIERVSKLTTSVAELTVAPLATTSSDVANNSEQMVKVPLITPNNSLSRGPGA